MFFAKSMILFGFIFMILMETCLTQNVIKSKNHHNEIQNLQKQVHSLVSSLEAQRKEIVELQLANTKQDGEITSLKKENEAFEKKYAEVSFMEPEIEETGVRSTSKDAEIGVYAEYFNYACLNEVIYLSCGGGKLIEVTSAFYSKYNVTCSAGCCIPTSADCAVNVEDNRIGDWVELQVLCNNQSECEYTYLGSVIDSCQIDYVADYMSIYYYCLPELDSDPVGFSAYAGQTRTYPNDVTIFFDGIITNLGGHYQTITSTFTCPFDGVYIFSAYLTNPDIDGLLHADIMQDDRVLVTIFVYTQGGNTVVTQCLTGQMVYVRWGSAANGLVFGDLAIKSTTFAGTLVQRY